MVIWLHGDHLSADNPALARFPDAPAVFVFDEAFLSGAGLAFHRLFFLYESVTDAFSRRPAGTTSVRRGRVAEEVLAFARERGATRVVTTQTVGGRFALYREEMARALPVVALPVPSLVPYDAARVPKRFSAWWREVEEEALAP